MCVDTVCGDVCVCVCVGVFGRGGRCCSKAPARCPGTTFSVSGSSWWMQRGSCMFVCVWGGGGVDVDWRLVCVHFECGLLPSESVPSESVVGYPKWAMSCSMHLLTFACRGMILCSWVGACTCDMHFCACQCSAAADACLRQQLVNR
jgi:hypothetical protein